MKLTSFNDYKVNEDFEGSVNNWTKKIIKDERFNEWFEKFQDDEYLLSEFEASGEESFEDWAKNYYNEL